MKQILFIISASFIFTRCASNDYTPPQTPQSSSISSSTEGALKAEVIPLDEPSHYSVHLTWSPVTTPVEGWLVQKRDAQSSFQTIAEHSSETFEHLDEVSQSGRVLYRVLPLGQIPRPSLTAEVTIPQDREIREDAVLTTLEVSGRIFLRSGARLFFEDREARLAAHEIFSEDALIQTFPDDSVASSTQNGTSGGILSIIANRAQGSLRVMLRGQKGGPGKEGVQGTAGRAGQNGSDGKADLDPEILAIARVFWTAINTAQIICIAPPGDGQAGDSGGMGSAGGDGGTGGNSGDLSVKIENADDFSLKPVAIAGAGGEPGLGGPGGPGGPGGLAGKPDPHKKCPIAKDGPGGEPGPRGPAGKRGLDGKKGFVSLNLGKHVRAD